MTPNANEFNGSDGGDRLDARVILVGRTGLDHTLRLDAGVELIRARTAIDAIGELAQPIDSESPMAATVILSREADPGPRASALIDSLRMVDPGVRVMLMGASTRGVYDGVILSPDVPAASLRRLLRRHEPSAGSIAAETPRLDPISQPDPVRPQQGATVAPPPAIDSTPQPTGGRSTPLRPSSLIAGVNALPVSTTTSTGPRQLDQVIVSTTDGPAPTAPATSRPPAASIAPADPPAGGAAGPEESDLLEALLTGRDLLLPLLALVRRRTGSPDVVFTPPGAPAAVMGTAEVSVVHRGRSLGTLSSRSATREALAAAANWFGAWVALRDQQEQLRDAAFTDDLTGAFNRRYFDRFLAAAIDRARGERQSVTVLYFDIDDFKMYNDRYGHIAGDEILQETVRLLKSVIRPTDKVCRIGGDEFAVVFFEPAGPRDPSSKPPSSIWGIASRFQRQICEHRFPKLAEKAPGTLTISGGLATFPWDGTTPKELVARADALALESKGKGKNVITLGPGAERVCKVDFGSRPE
ncbi:MAG: diguanylate cyclase [Phycisphaeraceae bacterium]|nr:diguanylate cyclase [Phycisphaeraceae bacterium]